MSVIKLDADMTNQFAASRFATLICAEDGKPLGFFLPPEIYKRLVYRNVEIPFSEEDLENRGQMAGGISLKQMWERMGNRIAAGETA